jgi:hypothetical protein
MSCVDGVLYPHSTDDFRDKRFKLIPSIVEGPFLVRKMVGNTPAIIGAKLQQSYFHKANSYFELDVDISSDAVAKRVTGYAMGYAKNLIVDMGFVIQGQTRDELPERIFGAVRLQHVDMTAATKLE